MKSILITHSEPGFNYVPLETMSEIKRRSTLMTEKIEAVSILWTKYEMRKLQPTTKKSFFGKVTQYEEFEYYFSESQPFYLVATTSGTKYYCPCSENKELDKFLGSDLLLYFMGYHPSKTDK